VVFGCKSTLVNSHFVNIIIIIIVNLDRMMYSVEHHQCDTYLDYRATKVCKLQFRTIHFKFIVFRSVEDKWNVSM